MNRQELSKTQEILVGAQPSLTKNGEWEPTENMLNFLQAMQDSEYAASVTDMCEKVGVSRPLYYQWLKNPNFDVWYRRESLKWAARQTPGVVQAIIDAGKGTGKGNPAAQKLFLELCVPEYSPKQRHEVEVTSLEVILGQLDGGREQIEGEVIDVLPIEEGPGELPGPSLDDDSAIEP